MATCSVRCKNEFRLKNFFFHYEEAQTFVQFQFGAQKAYLIWRLFWAIFHMAWVIFIVVFPQELAGQTRKDTEKWLIFLTDWSYLLLTLATILNFIVVCYVYFKRFDIKKGFSTDLPWYLKMAWAVVTTSNAAAITITICYWGLIYDNWPLNAKAITTHVVNAVYVIVNLMLTGMPTRLYHWWLVVSYGIVYALFSLFYYLADGLNNSEEPYVYKVMDWRKPGTTMIYVVGVLVISFVVHIVLFLFHSVKVCIFGKCCIKKEVRKDDTVENGVKESDLSAKF